MGARRLMGPWGRGGHGTRDGKRAPTTSSNPAARVPWLLALLQGCHGPAACLPIKLTLPARLPCPVLLTQA